MRFNSFRAKDPVLAAILSLGLVVGSQVLTRAQAAHQAGWEEVGPAANSITQQLISAPPRVTGGSHHIEQRSPVEPPSTFVRGDTDTPQNVYIVQPSDTLPKIAMKVYGDANRWQDLMVLNNIENGNRIFVGQKLVITAINSSVTHAAAQQEISQTYDNSSSDKKIPVISNEQMLDNSNHMSNATVESVSADAAGYYENTNGTYVVKRGDTLGVIAKRILGSTQKWRDIARANPSINPNRLSVGTSLVIPGLAMRSSSPEVTAVYAEALSPESWQTASAPSANRTALNYSTGIVNNSSFDPPVAPIMNSSYGAPPPPTMDSSYGAPPPPMPPIYSGGAMIPPPPPPSFSSPNLNVPGIMAPPAAPYMGMPVPEASRAMSPVAVSNRELYQEERYRIPDELKNTDFSPCFVNFNGYHGLFEVESALLPYYPTWNFAVQMKYENYKTVNGEDNILDESSEVIIPVHFTYTGKKMFAGLTIPFQNWEVNDTSQGLTSVKSSLSSLADPTLKVGYQVWKNLEGNHAVTIHAEGKFPSGNYQRPQFETAIAIDGETKDGAIIGPAGVSKSAEIQFGGAYSGRMNEKWTSHLNLAIAQNPGDSVSKLIFRSGIDYRVNRNFSIIGEINTMHYEIDNNDQAIYTSAGGLIKGKTSGATADFLVGFSFFNESWQGNLGFPISLQSDIGYGHDFGVMFGINHRWN